MRRFFKQFKNDTKEVFMMIKYNTNSVFLKISIYIFFIILLPLFFIVDLISDILGLGRTKNEKK